MSAEKKKLTPAQRANKKRMRETYEIVFINGKQKRVKRPPTIDGILVEELLLRNTDPGWLFENGMFEELHEAEQKEQRGQAAPPKQRPVGPIDDDEDLPF